MWKLITGFFGAWFRSATPQRADFESVVTLHERLSERLHKELVERDTRIDELERREDELTKQVRELREALDTVARAQRRCETERKRDHDTIGQLRKEIAQLRGN